MATLLEIGEEGRALESLINELPDGEITPDCEKVLDAWFEEVSTNREQKIDAYCSLIREFDLRASVRRSEMERLQKRVQADENLAKKLKDRLQFFFEMTGTKKIETRRYRVGIVGNGGKMPLELSKDAWDFPERLPEKFRRAEYMPDLAAIRNALEEGELLSFAKLHQRGKHMEIR